MGKCRSEEEKCIVETQIGKMVKKKREKCSKRKINTKLDKKLGKCRKKKDHYKIGTKVGKMGGKYNNRNTNCKKVENTKLEQKGKINTQKEW